MAMLTDVQQLAIRLAAQDVPDPHMLVVRGQHLAVGVSPSGPYSMIDPKDLVPVWVLYLHVAIEVKREAIALATA